MYDLATTGITDAKRELPLQREKFSYQSLTGLVDGTNKLFRTEYYPVETGTLTVYLDTTLQASNLYTADLETGTILFTTAPTVQPRATYTYIALTDTQIRDLLISAVTELESFWTRRWVVYNTSTYYYVAYLSDATYIDPVIGGTSFEDSLAAQKILFLCAEYILTRHRAEKNADTGMNYTQDTGLTVDNRQRAAQQANLLELIRKRLESAIVALQAKEITSDLGGMVSSPKTDTYKQVFRWQPSDTRAAD